MAQLQISGGLVKVTGADGTEQTVAGVTSASRSRSHSWNDVRDSSSGEGRMAAKTPGQKEATVTLEVNLKGDDTGGLEASQQALYSAYDNDETITIVLDRGGYLEESEGVINSDDLEIPLDDSGIATGSFEVDCTTPWSKVTNG